MAELNKDEIVAKIREAETQGRMKVASVEDVKEALIQHLVMRYRDGNGDIEKHIEECQARQDPEIERGAEEYKEEILKEVWKRISDGWKER